MTREISPKGRLAEVGDHLGLNYAEVQYCFVQFFSEHIADCSRQFDGDLQQMCILAVIGQTVLASSVRSPDGGPSRVPAISASRLADVCGIPRETVRRKLRLLEEKKWICRAGDEQVWTLYVENDGSRARKELSDLDTRSIKRLARLYVSIERVLARGATPNMSAGQPPSASAALKDCRG
ncbi:hypothetical protein [Bradyrhizobium sp. USDA 4353]